MVPSLHRTMDNCSTVEGSGYLPFWSIHHRAGSDESGSEMDGNMEENRSHVEDDLGTHNRPDYFRTESSVGTIEACGEDQTGDKEGTDSTDADNCSYSSESSMRTMKKAVQETYEVNQTEVKEGSDSAHHGKGSGSSGTVGDIAKENIGSCQQFIGEVTKEGTIGGILNIQRGLDPKPRIYVRTDLFISKETGHNRNLNAVTKTRVDRGTIEQIIEETGQENHMKYTTKEDVRSATTGSINFDEGSSSSSVNEVMGGTIEEKSMKYFTKETVGSSTASLTNPGDDSSSDSDVQFIGGVTEGGSIWGNVNRKRLHVPKPRIYVRTVEEIEEKFKRRKVGAIAKKTAESVLSSPAYFADDSSSDSDEQIVGGITKRDGVGGSFNRPGQLDPKPQIYNRTTEEIIEGTGQIQSGQEITNEAKLSAPTRPYISGDDGSDSDVQFIGEVTREESVGGNLNRQRRNPKLKPGQCRYILLFNSGAIEEIVKENDSMDEGMGKISEGVNRNQQRQNRYVFTEIAQKSSAERTVTGEGVVKAGTSKAADSSDSDVQFVGEVIEEERERVNRSWQRQNRQVFIEVPQTRIAETTVTKGKVQPGTWKAADSSDSDVQFMGGINEGAREEGNRDRQRQNWHVKGAGDVQSGTWKAADSSDSDVQFMGEVNQRAREEDNIDRQRQNWHWEGDGEVQPGTSKAADSPDDTGSSGGQENTPKRYLSPGTDAAIYKRQKMSEEGSDSQNETKDSRSSRPSLSSAHSSPLPDLEPLDLNADDLALQYMDNETFSSDSIVYDPRPISPPDLHTPSSSSSNVLPEPQQMIDHMDNIAALLDHNIGGQGNSISDSNGANDRDSVTDSDRATDRYFVTDNDGAFDRNVFTDGDGVIDSNGATDGLNDSDTLSRDEEGGLDSSSNGEVPNLVAEDSGSPIHVFQNGYHNPM